MRRPSPALIVAFLALIVALGGTALAATGQLVNIVDPGSPSQKARVDSSGALRVGEASPSTAFAGFTQPSSNQNVLGPTKATLAFTRLVAQNPAGNPTMRIGFVQASGSTSSCDNSSGTRALGIYSVPGGSTFADAMPTPTVVKPLASGHVWCLNVFYSFEGNPTSGFTFPSVNWSGYALSGTTPPSSGRATIAPRIHRGG